MIRRTRGFSISKFKFHNKLHWRMVHFVYLFTAPTFSTTSNSLKWIRRRRTVAVAWDEYRDNNWNKNCIVLWLQAGGVIWSVHCTVTGTIWNGTRPEEDCELTLKRNVDRCHKFTSTDISDRYLACRSKPIIFDYHLRVQTRRKVGWICCIAQGCT